MNRSHVQPKDRLYCTVADALGVDSTALSEESSPETLEQWDSLSHLQLVAAIESEFEISLQLDDMLRIRDLRSMRAVLHEQGAEV